MPWWGGALSIWRYCCPVCLNGFGDALWRPLIVLSDGRIWCQAALPLPQEYGHRPACPLTEDRSISVLLHALRLFEEA